MTNEKKCQSCGQKIRKLNPHSMDKQKIRVLEDIAKINETGWEWVQARAGWFLTYGTDSELSFRTAYRAQAHASRLLWFGLLEYQGTRTGNFKVKDSGKLFLAGLHSVPDKIYCRDGVVVESSSKMTFIEDIKDVVFDKTYWDNYWTTQKYQEKPAQGTLFR